MTLIDSAAREFAAHQADPRIERVRRRALQQLRNRGVPTSRHEDWKYTDLSDLDAHDYFITEKSTLVGDLPLAALDAYRLVFMNGQFVTEKSDLANLPAHVKLNFLRELAVHDPAEAAARLEPYTTDDAKVFGALNAAIARDGAYIQVANNCVLDKPLLVIFATTSREGASWSAPQLELNLGANAQAALLEVHCGQDNQEYFTTAVTRLSTSTGAHLAHYRVVLDSSRATHVGQVVTDTGSDSTLDTLSLALGGRRIRIDVDCALAATGGTTNLNGVFICGEGQHIDHHTRVDHRANHTHSNETYKGIAAGTGRGVFNGKIIVHAGIRKVTATQASHNLLLSDAAEIDTKPELEIYADDLRCSHGATVGQLDDAALFYLRSRGVNLEAARALLTYGFIEEMIADIPYPSLHELIATRIVADNPTLATLLTEKS
jgi:Fe-S cluster assembly protein SufD